MISISQNSDSAEYAVIGIGLQGENNARQVQFDLSYLIDNFGDGTAVLVHQRVNDTAPYNCSTSQADGVLTWTITNTDTAQVGIGKCEIRWTVGDTLAKTIIYRTRVIQSITAGTVIPEQYQSWYDQMIAYIDQLKVDSDARLVQAVEDAEDAAEAAGTSETNAANSATNAATSETNAANSATAAGTSETNAANSATSAAASAAAAAQSAASSGYMWFTIEDDGHLYLDKTDNVDVDFSIGTDGHLYVEASA